MTFQVTKLKNHIYQLYKKLGYSDDQANFHMLTEAEDWNNLEEPVNNIMMNSKYIYQKVVPKAPADKKKNKATTSGAKRDKKSPKGKKRGAKKA